MREGLSELLQSKIQPGSTELQKLGVEIGKINTDHGLPIDMALTRLQGYTKEQKLSVLDGALQWIIQHKRNSAATGKAIERTRISNRRAVEAFIKTGETGIY